MKTKPLIPGGKPILIFEHKRSAAPLFASNLYMLCEPRLEEAPEEKTDKNKSNDIKNNASKIVIDGDSVILKPRIGFGIKKK